MKIAFFVAEYPNPSETFITRHISGMQARGHDVTIIAGQLRASAENVQRDGIKVRLLRGSPTGLKMLLLRLNCGFQSLVRLRRLSTIFRELRQGSLTATADLLSCPRHLGHYDAIVAHFGPMGVRASALRQAGMLNGPLSVIFHGKDMSDHWTLKRYLPFYRDLFRSAERLLPISRLWRDRLIGWGAHPAKIRILRMGVDLALLEAVPDARPLQSPMRILSVARLVEKKGLHYAIEGVKQASSAIEYNIIGYGPLESLLADQASGSGNRISLLGPQPHAEVFRRLTASDIFLLPSVTAADGDMEGIPVALMEAMAMGVLVIATRHSGIPELIDDGIEGFLVPERDAAAIAEALGRIASGSVDVVAMRQAARAKVQREYNNATLDKELETLLLELQPNAEEPAKLHRHAVPRPSLPA